MSNYSKAALFIGGTLFGSVGLKLLTSREAKKAYVYATAAGLCAKDYLMETVTSVQENAADILASAKEIKADWLARRAEEDAAADIPDTADDSTVTIPVTSDEDADDIPVNSEETGADA